LSGTSTVHECKRALLRAALQSNVEVNRIWVRETGSFRRTIPQPLPRQKQLKDSK
jgi:hypothetical protein